MRLAPRNVAVAGAGALVGALIAGAVVAVVTNDHPRAKPPAGSVEPLRLGEVRMDVPAVRQGKLTLMPVGVKCGMGSLIGTHAEFFAKGQYCRLRIALLADDSSYVPYNASRLRLVTTKGKASPDHDAMLIARQPTTASIGAHNRLSVDVWFDYPLGAQPLSVSVGGGAPSAIPLPERRWPDPVKL